MRCGSQFSTLYYLILIQCSIHTNYERDCSELRLVCVEKLLREGVQTKYHESPGHVTITHIHTHFVNNQKSQGRTAHREGRDTTTQVTSTTTTAGLCKEKQENSHTQ